MKSTLIAVCGLMAALIAVQPAFAKDKRTSPRPNDSLAPARSALSGPSPSANSFRRFPSGSSPQSGEGVPKAAKPVAVVKASPPKETGSAPRRLPIGDTAECHSALQFPWVGLNVRISDSERHVIRAYVHHRVEASKGGKFNGVRQGLAKKVAWGNKLPPGWQQKCVRGEVLPSEVHKHCQPLPHDIILKLPPSPPGTLLLAVDGKVLRVAYPTYEILDVFDVL